MSGFYHVLLADPPWRYRVWTGQTKKKRTADSHYRTMDFEDLVKMRGMIDRMAGNPCALLLWVTPPTMFEYGLPLLESWGFDYKTVAFVWVKTNPRSGGIATGMGHYTRSNAELCLLATRGRMRRLSASVGQVIIAPRRRHSEKPVEQYRRVENLFGGPYMELFARRVQPGWDSWGDQVKGNISADEGSILAHRRPGIRPFV